ncbi:MAG TPA: sulfotransferase [Kiloniellales bacterium]|nr:sulfotransferase [Kiloniellales bacterium]
MTNSAPPPQLFFCTGLAKSGTTYLQALLNSHPQISCAEEQDLWRLIELLREMATRYNQRAVTLDLRTGGHGRPAFDAGALRDLARSAMLAIVHGRAAGKPIAGAKDNRMFDRLDVCGAMFPEARFLCIVRNPLDRAVSAWHHNLRLAEREQDPRHSELMLRHGGLEGWARHLCGLHRTDMAAFLAASQTRERRLLLRYEDLVLDPLPQLRRTLAFLGAEADEATLSAMLERTSLAALRSSAAEPAFFRSGAISAGAGELPTSLRLALASDFAVDMAQLGYSITAEGLEVLPLELA